MDRNESADFFASSSADASSDSFAASSRLVDLGIEPILVTAARSEAQSQPQSQSQSDPLVDSPALSCVSSATSINLLLSSFDDLSRQPELPPQSPLAGAAALSPVTIDDFKDEDAFMALLALERCFQDPAYMSSLGLPISGPPPLASRFAPPQSPASPGPHLLHHPLPPQQQPVPQHNERLFLQLSGQACGDLSAFPGSLPFSSSLAESSVGPPFSNPLNACAAQLLTESPETAPTPSACPSLSSAWNSLYSQHRPPFPVATAPPTPITPVAYPAVHPSSDRRCAVFSASRCCACHPHWQSLRRYFPSSSAQLAASAKFAAVRALLTTNENGQGDNGASAPLAASALPTLLFPPIAPPDRSVFKCQSDALTPPAQLPFYSMPTAHPAAPSVFSAEQRKRKRDALASAGIEPRFAPPFCEQPVAPGGHARCAESHFPSASYVGESVLPAEIMIRPLLPFSLQSTEVSSASSSSNDSSSSSLLSSSFSSSDSAVAKANWNVLSSAKRLHVDSALTYSAGAAALLGEQSDLPPSNQPASGRTDPYSQPGARRLPATPDDVNGTTKFPWESKIECGFIEYADNRLTRTYSLYSPFFNSEMRVFKAQSDPFCRLLFRTKDVATFLRCSPNMLAMYFKRRKHLPNSGIFQATQILYHEDGHFEVKAGSYFVTLEACQEAQRYLNSRRLPSISYDSANLLC